MKPASLGQNQENKMKCLFERINQNSEIINAHGSGGRQYPHDRNKHSTVCRQLNYDRKTELSLQQNKKLYQGTSPAQFCRLLKGKKKKEEETFGN